MQNSSFSYSAAEVEAANGLFLLCSAHASKTLSNVQMTIEVQKLPDILSLGKSLGFKVNSRMDHSTILAIFQKKYPGLPKDVKSEILRDLDKKQLSNPDAIINESCLKALVRSYAQTHWSRYGCPAPTLVRLWQK